MPEEDSRHERHEMHEGNQESVLTLSCGTLPPLSARGCRQTLTTESMGYMRRTIHGTATFLSLMDPQQAAQGGSGQAPLKYHSIIECKDRLPPPFGGLSPGQCLVVGCIQSLCEPVHEQESVQDLKRHRLTRAPVAGSLRPLTAEGHCVPLERESFQENDRVLLLSQQVTCVLYRPALEMMVLGHEVFTDEWGDLVGWKLRLAEV